MVLTGTGNKLDVVTDMYKKGDDGNYHSYLAGLREWGYTRVIPLPDPLGLVKAVMRVYEELYKDSRKNTHSTKKGRLIEKILADLEELETL